MQACHASYLLCTATLDLHLTLAGHVQVQAGQRAGVLVLPLAHKARCM